MKTLHAKTKTIFFLLIGLVYSGMFLFSMGDKAYAGQLTHPAAKLAWQTPTPFAQLPTKIQKKLKAGKRVVKLFYRKNDKGKKMIVAQAIAIIKRSPAKVYAELAKVEKIAEFMPKMVFSKIVKKFNKHKYHMHRVLKVLWTKIHMHLIVTLEPNKRVKWYLIRGKKNGIKDTVGAMNFEPIEGGKATLVTYRVYSDTGRAIPGFVRKMLIKSSLPNVLKSLKKRVMSGGRWKK